MFVCALWIGIPFAFLLLALLGGLRGPTWRQRYARSGYLRRRYGVISDGW